MPFVRDNSLFKQFLEVTEHYIEEEFDSKKQYQSIGNPFGNINSNFSSNSSGRSSVLNPFQAQNKNNLIVMKQAEGGRKSVAPVMNGANHNSDISLINKKMAGFN